jgi:lysozyme
MKISQNCLELITKFEGCRLEAYLDINSIPVIGYGINRYPNGQKVQLGNKITQQQADAFLKLECDKVAEEVSQLVSGIPLNQNQFDALVSFSYNFGSGALAESTLLKKLKSNDFAGAASEFDRWVKGTVNGEKVTLEGLVKRRKEERALFEKQGGEGTPTKVTESLQDKVTLLEGYRDFDKNVIVAWAGSEVVEILSLESQIKEDLISVLQQYKNANNFVFAPPGKVIPIGKRTSVAGKGKPLFKLSKPFILKRTLVRGMEGEDVKELQKRLNDLSYNAGSVDGVFGAKTDQAVKDFQARYFGLAEADGKVGKLTWEKMHGDVTPHVPVPKPVVSGKTYLRLTNTERLDADGCYILNLEYFKNGQLKDKLEVCSGGPWNQNFCTASETFSGSFEPLPEGKWFIGDLAWADGTDNYDGEVFNSGIGPVSIPLDYVKPGTTDREAIEIHIDWNKDYGAPGTAGCIGISTIADYKVLVSWLRESNPRDLFVDWGLGTCPQV